MKEHYAMANIKLQTESKEREAAITKTIARLDAGDASGVVDYYNKFLPTGDKLTGVELGKDGKVVAQRVRPDGSELPPMTMGSIDELRTGLLKSADYKFAYQISQDQFTNNLKLRSERRADNADRRAAGADARVAASHGIAMEDRRERLNDKRELRDVREAMARESNPSIRTPRSGRCAPASCRHPVPTTPRPSTTMTQ